MNPPIIRLRTTGGDIIQSHKCETLLTLVSIASSRRRTMKITLRNFVQNVLEIVMFIYNQTDKWIKKSIMEWEQYEQQQRSAKRTGLTVIKQS